MSHQSDDNLSSPEYRATFFAPARQVMLGKEKVLLKEYSVMISLILVDQGSSCQNSVIQYMVCSRLLTGVLVPTTRILFA